ncbi:guanine-1-methyltransferase-domain-containing protein [Zychaea mexicana]|uniref:guanine-1-methyltransferase-domain-containing protein n=1 Tax=Zychaea mexicana TaxID=64656 RepID=UPI0022FE03CD|nr:guanine-1-methyltransferase-domain-containing protein [Zychaea mexicana]KAI9490994.1 guanine-1-methyltransferase-domain-containing protein [Zychaea mexicana]
MADDDHKPELVASNASDNIRTYKGITYDITDPKYQGLSKNALKKLLREEVWNATREKRNKFQKEKKKQKSAERRKLIEEGVIPAPPPKRARTVEPSSVRVVMDCSFTSYMHDTEIKSMQAQLVRCHSANRAGAHPMEITITSFDDALKNAFEKKTPTYTNWKNIEFTTESYMDKFDTSKLVYLSADSDNVVRELEDDKVYIIGGIVDKNRHKGLCQNKATDQGIQTAALPIGEYLHMASRKVLTVNHVYEIMIKWLETRDWEKAFLEVIPGRKLKDSKLLGDDASKASSDTGDKVEEAENNEGAPKKDEKEMGENAKKEAGDEE